MNTLVPHISADGSGFISYLFVYSPFFMIILLALKCLLIKLHSSGPPLASPKQRLSLLLSRTLADNLQGTKRTFVSIGVNELSTGQREQLVNDYISLCQSTI